MKTASNKNRPEVLVKVKLPTSIHKRLKAAAAMDGVKIGDKAVSLLAKALGQ